MNQSKEVILNWITTYTQLLNNLNLTGDSSNETPTRYCENVVLTSISLFIEILLYVSILSNGIKSILYVDSILVYD